MVTFPPCKVNLGLHILRRREDGYHDIDTCFYPVPFTDILEIIQASYLHFSSSGLLIPGNSKDNLCLKAYSLLKDDYDLPAVHIHLHKIIPTGAGLGGGSSDAAYTLKMLNALFKLDLPTERLSAYAALLGSDCTFFLHEQPMIGSGRGELLTPVQVELQGKYLILLNPGLHVSTADAYAGTSPTVPQRTIRDIVSTPVGRWKDALKNDFEVSVFTRFPLIGELKQELYDLGAIYASMSGSGSSVFGIFDHEASLPSAGSKFVIWKGFIN